MKAIKDEFTGLKVSRQVKWQLRMEKQSRCRICGKDANEEGRFCRYNLKDNRDRANAWYRKNKHE